jgi:hypothetical protein
LLKPAVEFGRIKKSGRKTGVLSEERVGGESAERTAGQREDLCGLHDSLDDDDEEDYEGEDGPGTFYSPVIAIDDKSLLDVLKHPKKH